MSLTVISSRASEWADASFYTRTNSYTFANTVDKLERFALAKMTLEVTEGQRQWRYSTEHTCSLSLFYNVPRYVATLHICGKSICVCPSFTVLGLLVVLYGRQHDIKKKGISRLSYRTKQARGRNFSYKAQKTDIDIRSRFVKSSTLTAKCDACCNGQFLVTKTERCVGPDLSDWLDCSTGIIDWDPALKSVPRINAVLGADRSGACSLTVQSALCSGLRCRLAFIILTTHCSHN